MDPIAPTGLQGTDLAELSRPGHIRERKTPGINQACSRERALS